MKLGVIRATDGVFADQILGERERQEDAVAHRVFNDGDSMLVVLADGMGGHKGGEVASQTSVDSFISAFLIDFPALKVSYRLFGALERANKELESLGKKNADLEGMGSTLVAATFSQLGMSWISVGDSLLLRVRGRALQRLNQDHSMAPVLDEAVKKGTLTRELAASHKDRNALRSAVTGAAIDLVDISDRAESLRAGDVILLASDGLLTLSNDEIIRIVRTKKAAGARTIVSALLEAVSQKKRRRQDNTTVAAIVIERPSTRDFSADRTWSPLRSFGVTALICSILIAVLVGLSLSLVKPVSDLLQVVSSGLQSDLGELIDGNKTESVGAESVDISSPPLGEDTPVKESHTPSASEAPNLEQIKPSVGAGGGSQGGVFREEENDGEVGASAISRKGEGQPPQNKDDVGAAPNQQKESQSDSKYPKISRPDK